jgi:hypothetical protein
MAIECLTVGEVLAELVQFRMFRRDGLTEHEAAASMGLSPATATDYESAIRALAALQSGTAPDAPGAAPDPLERNHHV